MIREKFSGEITVKGTDFDTLIAFEGSALQYAIVIHQECAGVYSELWKGFFSYFDFKVDLDTCYLTFEPTVWDAYSPVYDQFPVERNVLGAGDQDSVFMDSYNYDYEDVYHTYTLIPGAPVPVPTWTEYTGYTAGNQYYLYSRIAIDPTPPGYIDIFWAFEVTDTYRRDYLLTTSNTPTGNWVLDPQLTPAGVYSPGVYKWVRPYLDSAYTTPYTSFISNDYVSYILFTNTSINVELTGCILLKDILDYFSDLFNLTYESDFFNDSPCPMGGNSLNLTYIQQISNLRDTSDPASKGIMKLKDLLIWIRDTFNCYPYIDSAGDFRIEHRKYFENGLSYTVQAGITMDLGILYPSNILKMSKYEWSEPELYRFETLEIPLSNFPDWTDAKIEYPQLSILGQETKNIIVDWSTDIVSMYAQRADLPKRGWVLLNVELLGAPAILKVVSVIGAITGDSMPNARFSQANLFRDLWTWGRLLPTGNMNSVATTFSSIERLRKQVEITIPQCCQVIDYNGIFRTPLGDGLLDKGSYEAKTGMLKMNLIYE